MMNIKKETKVKIKTIIKASFYSIHILCLLSLLLLVFLARIYCPHALSKPVEIPTIVVLVVIMVYLLPNSVGWIISAVTALKNFGVIDLTTTEKGEKKDIN